PGILLTVLCSEDRKEEIMRIIFRETSTIGLRYYETKRKILKRQIKKINTEFGEVRVKFSLLGDEVLKTSPEYEDCRKIALKKDIPLTEIIKKIQRVSEQTSPNSSHNVKKPISQKGL
ncbi:MAG: nickel insertion protein, partial [Nitrospirota bacterium]